MRAHRLKEVSRASLEIEVAESAHGVDARNEDVEVPSAPERNRQTSCCAFDAWNRLRSREKLIPQIQALHRVERHTAILYLDPEQSIAIVSKPQSTHVDQAPNKQTGTNEKYDGERGLSD
jgi:hypothetical protein